jgi:tetratricopeptide (TPR) repeat protein
VRSRATQPTTSSQIYVSARIVLLPCLFIAVAFCFAPRIAKTQSSELSGVSALVDQGKFAEAERQLHQYLLKRPQSSKANSLLAKVYLRQEKFEQAEQALQKAIASAPNLVEPRLSLGDAYVAEGKLDLAVEAYESVIKLAPHDARAGLALAKLYLGEGAFAKSLEAAGSIPPEKRAPELLPTLAADYFGLQQVEKAGLEVQNMLQIADKHPDLIPELAEFFLAHHDFKSSQQLLELAQPKQPATDRFLVALARTQAGLGELKEAQESLETVFARSPQFLDALIVAGQVASQQTDWAAATEAFSRAHSLAPSRPDILYGLVSAELYGNQTSAAIKDAQRLHALIPQDLRATYLLALALFGEKRWDEARVHAEKVLAAHPDDREMNLLLVDVAINNDHNFSLARKYVEPCLKRNPSDPGALYYLGMIQKMEGDITGAIDNLSKSVAANPKNGDAQGALGGLYLQAGDVNRAVRALEQAVALVPEEAQNHYQLALAYSRLNAPDKAKAQLDVYQQMKAKEIKDAKDSKGPSTSEIPPMGISARPYR